MFKNKTSAKLSAGIAVLIGLVACLCITTLALVYVTESAENNSFETGSIGINLNDGQAVIAVDEFIFEPGVTVEKDFFVENTGTDGIYYKLYFKDVSGGLADIIDVTLKDGEKILASGKLSELTEDAVNAADEILAEGEKKELKIFFRFPEDAGNSFQNEGLSFAFYAKAVQSKNNTEKVFD